MSQCLMFGRTQLLSTHCHPHGGAPITIIAEKISMDYVGSEDAANDNNNLCKGENDAPISTAAKMNYK